MRHSSSTARGRPGRAVIEDLVDFSDFLPTIADITGAKLPDVALDGRSFWPQCQGKTGDPRQWIFQYYYPKFKAAADAHGQGVNSNEIVWAQTQKFKLYRDGSLYATADRHEKRQIEPQTDKEADAARTLLQGAIDSMPTRAAKLAGQNEKIVLFDGESLDGWTNSGSARWRIENKILTGGQDGDPKRSGLLMTKQQFKNFELELEFKIDEHGKYNSGVYLRRSPEARGLECYQVNIGRGAAEEYTGLYLDDWLDKGDEHDKIRKPNEWNHLRVRAIGAHIQVWLNREKIVDYTDKNPKPELLEAGSIALQTYGAEGHAGWVKFREIYATRL